MQAHGVVRHKNVSLFGEPKWVCQFCQFLKSIKLAWAIKTQVFLDKIAVSKMVKFVTVALSLLGSSFTNGSYDGGNCDQS